MKRANAADATKWNGVKMNGADERHACALNPVRVEDAWQEEDCSESKWIPLQLRAIEF
jgi:hypothetical protein